MALVEEKQSPGADEADKDPFAALVPRAVAGDAVALRGLLGALAPEMARVARAMGGGAEIEDVVQEALLGLVHALPAFRGECGLRRFANRIAVRTALRARRRTTARETRQRGMSQPEAEALLHGAADGTPAELWLAARRKDLLQRLLDDLPEAQAETLALRVMLGMSLEETAAAMGVPVNTVRSRVRLAREALRARIESAPSWRELLEDEP